MRSQAGAAVANGRSRPSTIDPGGGGHHVYDAALPRVRMVGWATPEEPCNPTSSTARWRGAGSDARQRTTRRTTRRPTGGRNPVTSVQDPAGDRSKTIGWIAECGTNPSSSPWSGRSSREATVVTTRTVTAVTLRSTAGRIGASGRMVKAPGPAAEEAVSRIYAVCRRKHPW